ncbi:precorrin-6A/cobalt-precorrin-6A reductase [Celeribacter halophilus]|uniref:Precorrin-6x reductase CbiJ/CobK n=1 Tax=Celeribacter halophilus TaxID=576117 RepID=A0A1I3TDU1_9RHOB|nr:precorrin-6A/cobalt-precorrin-6A reductase [Celeribacter halophilus]PZX11123.1 precorrin-6x reductase CbiJ/CobK [Celeribacter halophilus]SFJ68780.1 Precorrin-6x reductase CbiJ/CobK [Celeribacter halophilus]
MILLLGGTREARNLAQHMGEAGLRFLVGDLALPSDDPLNGQSAIRLSDAMQTRVIPDPEALLALFEGADIGLDITAVIDAGPAFDSRTAPCVALCRSRNLPYLRYERAGLRSQPGDAWHHVKGLKSLMELIPVGARVLCEAGPVATQIETLLQERRVTTVPSISSAQIVPTGTAAPDWLVVLRATAQRQCLDTARHTGLQVAMLSAPVDGTVERREHLLDALEWAEAQSMAAGGVI